jgi:hypothetical protein
LGTLRRLPSKLRRMAVVTRVPSLLGLTLALAAAFASPAIAASAPTAQTDTPTITSAATATLNGEVMNNGLDTTYSFGYATASSDWCQSGGASGNPDVSTQTQSVSAALNDDVVSIDVSGLTAGAGYCYAVVASSSAGEAPVETVSFTAGAPGAYTAYATPQTGTSEAISGGADAAGQPSTVQVVYDVASSTWCTSDGAQGSPGQATAPEPLDDSQLGPQPVLLTVDGLASGVSYCAAVEVTNASGTTVAPAPTTFVAGSPQVDTDAASATGGSTATVSGDVDPSGQTTTYFARYALTGSTWCQSAGASGSSSTSQTVTLGVADGAFHEVSVSISGLTPGGSYCAYLFASNGAGTAASTNEANFTAGLPQATTLDAVALDAADATVDGQVDPSGQSTTYHVQYDLASSSWCQSNGTSGSPSYTTAALPLGYTDEQAHDVAVQLIGLSPTATYCMQLVASNASGTSTGGIVSPPPPVVLTTTVEPSGGSAATVVGTVDPMGGSTGYFAQFAPASSTWCQQNGAAGGPSQAVGGVLAGSGGQSVSVTIGGLTPGTQYCAQLAAGNGAGTGGGGQITFTTGTGPSVPAATTQAVTVTGAATATVTGVVNAGGQTTTYFAQYDAASSPWCVNGSGTPAYSTGAVTLSASDPSQTSGGSVSVALPNLSAGTVYCVRLTATNAAGTTTGNPVAFTQQSATTAPGDSATGPGTGGTTATAAAPTTPSQLAKGGATSAAAPACAVNVTSARASGSRSTAGARASLAVVVRCARTSSWALELTVPVRAASGQRGHGASAARAPRTYTVRLSRRVPHNGATRVQILLPARVPASARSNVATTVTITLRARGDGGRQVASTLRKSLHLVG